MAIHVTEAESQVLSALWRAGPLSAARLIEAVKARNAWGDATVKTLLGRLMRKGAVKSIRDDGRQLYHPVVSRDDYVQGEVAALVERLFEGDPRGLAALLAEGGGGG